MNRELWYKCPGFCGQRGSLGAIIIIVVIIGTIIWGLTPPEPKNSHSRSTRAVIDKKSWEQAQTYIKDNPTNNLWLAYMNYTSRTFTEDSCLACAKARPTLMAVPMPFNSSHCYNEMEENDRGTNCGGSTETPRLCNPDCSMRILHALGSNVRYPNRKGTGYLEVSSIKIMEKPQEAPITFIMCKTCQFECYRYDRRGGTSVGQFPNCHVTWNVTKSSDAGSIEPAAPIGSFTKVGRYTFNINGILRAPPIRDNFIQQRQSLSDFWWMCGGRPLQTLPYNWMGTCTQVMFATDGVHVQVPARSYTNRKKRSMPGGSFDPRVYIDAIGVPRGVPDEFEARNQAAGAMPLFWDVEPSKDAVWINYTYYNQQRFRRDLGEQLAPTSLTAWQTRMGVDMLQAEKGGLCVMFGDTCYTFIPNNTAPGGSLTRAIDGLRALGNELAANAGRDRSIWEWIGTVFGKWKGLYLSILTLIVATGLFALCGFCIIPRVRGRIMRATEKALTRQMLQDVPAPMNEGDVVLDEIHCEGFFEIDTDSDVEKEFHI